MKSLAIILLFLCGIFFFVPGCDSDESSAEEKRLTIAVIPKGTMHEFWQTVQAGAIKAARELDVDIIWKGPLKEDDRESQISVVETLIARDVSGIALAPLDDTALRMPVSNATRSGIPVLIFDSGLKGKDYISYVATDNFRGGQMAGEYMAKLLNGKGKVVVLRYSEGSDSTTRREEGFLDAVSKFESIEVVNSNQYAGVTTETAIKAAENIFLRFSTPEGGLEIDGIFCSAEPVTLGILRALESTASAGKVKFVGFDSSDMMIDAVKRGTLQGFIVQNPMQIGYLSVKTMVSHLNGQPVPARIDTGATLITAENIDLEETKALISPDLTEWLD